MLLRALFNALAPRGSLLVALTIAVAVAGCSDQPLEPALDETVATFDEASFNVVEPGSQVVLDGMYYHGCAFYPAQGNVECWDHPRSPWLPGGAGTPGDDYGQDADYLGGDAVDFAVGTFATCVLKATGNTACWGHNAVQLSYSGGDAADLVLGNGGGCVLTTDGDVKCVGPYFPSGTSYQPVYSGGDAEWIQMAAWSVCWGTTSGLVGCYGWNVTENPWTVAGTATPVGGGFYALCLLTEEGNVDCMNNTYNEIGQTMGYQGGDAVHTDASFDRGCAATSDGDVECWGRPNQGYATHGFQRWTQFSDVDAVAVVTLHEEICYLTSDNQVNCQWTETEATPPVTDTDGDGVNDDVDNCPAQANADQADYDGDGQGDVCDPDIDGDGVPNGDDAFPFSNQEPTVSIGGTDTGVGNQALTDGSTFSDNVNACSANANNHGRFVSCVTKLANDWRRAGLISNADKAALTTAAARSNVGK